MSNLFVACLCCGKKADLVGYIPSTDFFAGRLLEKPVDGGGLYRCKACLLGFRWPRLSKQELDVLYAQGDEFAWSESDCLRRDWRLAREWILERVPKGGEILDIGCFDGGFLAGIANLYKCYGIEIHPQARARAEQNRVSIVGEDFSDIRGEFDCVTAIDVIEHVENPEHFLSQVLSVVRPGGWALISTGNFNSLTFRIMGAKYWYCSIAEHISFVSPEWFFRGASKIGFKIVGVKKFSHGDGGVTVRIKELIANIIYWVHPSFLGLLRKIGLGKANSKSSIERPPSWISARDHFMVLIQKI